MLQPAVRQPVGDFGAVQQPLAASEVAVLTQHPAFRKTLVSPGTPPPRAPHAGQGESGAGAHLHPALDAHRQHVVVEALRLEAPHFAVELDLLPLEALQPMQEDGGLREKLRDGGRR